MEALVGNAFGHLHQSHYVMPNHKAVGVLTKKAGDPAQLILGDDPLCYSRPCWEVFCHLRLFSSHAWNCPADKIQRIICIFCFLFQSFDVEVVESPETEEQSSPYLSF